MYPYTCIIHEGAIAEMYLTDLCDAPTAEANCTECVQRALKFDPNHPQALQTLASIYISTHKNAEALALMQRAVLLWHVKAEDAEAAPGPGFGGAGGGGGGAAAAAGGSGGGVARASPTQELPPYEVRLSAAKLLMELHQHAIAIEILDVLLLEDAEIIETWYLMGVAHNLLKNVADAIEFLLETRRLYAKLGCEQPGILAHVQQLLASFPAAQVAATLAALQDEQGTGGGGSGGGGGAAAAATGGGGMDMSAGL